MSNKPILGGSQALRRACWTMALMASVWTVSACGQKGPLYMPPPPSAAPATAAPQPAKAVPDDKTKPADAAVSAPAR